MSMKLRNKIPLILLIFNVILIGVSWMMSLYSYPRLPQKMPLWLTFLDAPSFNTNKSLLFFLCPTAQTLFFLIFLFLSRSRWLRRMAERDVYPVSSGREKDLFSDFEKEFAYLALIFFNLIFIHVQRSLILVAHGVEKGISTLYFWSLFGILLLFIPYYRLRRRILIQKRKSVE